MVGHNPEGGHGADSVGLLLFPQGKKIIALVMVIFAYGHCEFMS